MKIIDAKQIEESVYLAAAKMCFEVDREVITALEEAYSIEEGNAKLAISDILENIKISKNKSLPVCQDTGMVIVFAEIGQNIFISGDFNFAVNNAVRRAYKDNYLRKSVVHSPLLRKNTSDNTPAIIYPTVTQGDKLRLTICPKGAGSENMGQVRMLNPSDGTDGICDFVLETVRQAGGRACPPLIVGVGIGGDMAQCALLSKRALLRSITDTAKDGEVCRLEEMLLEKINSLGIGAMGLTGKITALSVKVETYPCHIASLPVAVSLMCHAARHARVEL